jgi:integrase
MPKAVEYVAKDGTVSWRVRVRAHGKYTSETFRSEALAVRFCNTVVAIGPDAAVDHRARTDPRDRDYVPTVAEWLERHVEQLTGVTERTRMDYRAMAKRTWLPHLGDVTLDVVDRETVARVVNALERQGLSAKSIANAHSLMSATFTSAALAGHIPVNPCMGIRLPRAREQDRRDERFLTYREYLRLLACFPREHRPLVAFLFGTGLRWSEATALQVRDVAGNARPPVVRVTKAWKSTPGKPREVGPPKSLKSRRSVILGQGVLTAIEPLLERAPDAFLFAAPKGGPLHHGNWRYRYWVPAITRARLIPAPRIHDARHTHASWLLEMGASLEQVQDQLGHESILTTRKVYGHLQPAMRLAMADYATRALLPRPTRADESPAPGAIALRP